MELKDTIVMMQSDDYKERFKAEYYQLAIRYHKLLKMCESWDKLDFEPTSPRYIYAKQLNTMLAYKDVLDERARLEGVIFDEIF